MAQQCMKGLILALNIQGKTFCQRWQVSPDVDTEVLQLSAVRVCLARHSHKPSLGPLA
jgi:hypothetical protein